MSTSANGALSESLSNPPSADGLTRKERRFLARLSPALFGRFYLKTDDGEPLWPACELHWQWIDLMVAMQEGRVRRAVRMAPKGHAKSTYWTKLFVLWLTCAIDPNVRIIIAAVNAELAERFQRANRRELEQNQLLVEDFGPFKPAFAEKWTQTELIVNRTINSPSPTWRAVGSGAPVQGGRSNFIVGDDIADLENSATRAGSDKLELWTDSDLSGTLEPDGAEMFVGTAKTNDDLYRRKEQVAQSEPGSWDFQRVSAIVNDEQRETIWPERWSYDALMDLKIGIGSHAFDRDFRNIAVSDDTALFPLAILDPALKADLTFWATYEGEDDVVAGIDWAIVEDEREAQRKDTDFTVAQVWRLNPKGRQLLWQERFRGLLFRAQLQRIIPILQRYPTLRIGVSEANQAQKWASSELLRLTTGELPIYAHTTQRGVHVDVYAGVPSLTALFDARGIWLPTGDARCKAEVDVFKAELHGLGVEAHDDTVMAFYLADVGARKIRGGRTWTTAKRM